MFGVTGAGLSKFRNMQNGGKRARRSVDAWDRVSVLPGMTSFAVQANLLAAKYDTPNITAKIHSSAD